MTMYKQDIISIPAICAALTIKIIGTRMLTAKNAAAIFFTNKKSFLTRLATITLPSDIREHNIFNACFFKQHARHFFFDVRNPIC